MKIQVLPSYDALSENGADEMIKTIARKPDALICLASGHSPLKTCEIFAERVKKEKIDISRVFFIGLDEWVGVGKDDPGSCQYFFRTNIIQPLGLSEKSYHLFDVAADLKAECQKMDRIIADKGGIDLMIVGIGMNGHIGFNEPGVPFDLMSHVIALDNTTQEVGQKYFNEKKVLKQGITLGFGHLLNSRKVILLANGAKKADIVAKALSGPVSGTVPASVLQQHPNSLVILDEEAAAGL